MSSDEQHRAPPPVRATAAVASAGEPHGSSESPENQARADQPPGPDELDARQQNIRLQRKAMGPVADVAETVPEEIDEGEG